MTQANTAVPDRDALRELVADVLDIPAEMITDDAHFAHDLEVDSLMALELMVIMERTYGVKLDETRLKEVTSLARAHALLVEELSR
ncbi:phosphopantetheine-binding protein [Streptomyces sp. NPDC007991]|uniref:acyl carrier protein n=1 Tax=Streptomyces sp. NPDC007991 TaxID=3364803 RepID=UPI0036E6F57D